MKWRNVTKVTPKNWNPDFYFYHLRYADDHVKVDTDLFEMSELGLIKKGGVGFLPFSNIEWLDETTCGDGWEAQQEKLWYEAKKIIMRHYHDYNYPVQAVKELMQTYTITPKKAKQ